MKKHGSSANQQDQKDSNQDCDKQDSHHSFLEEFKPDGHAKTKNFEFTRLYSPTFGYQHKLFEFDDQNVQNNEICRAKELNHHSFGIQPKQPKHQEKNDAEGINFTFSEPESPAGFLNIQHSPLPNRLNDLYADQWVSPDRKMLQESSDSLPIFHFAKKSEIDKKQVKKNTKTSLDSSNKNRREEKKEKEKDFYSTDIESKINKKRTAKEMHKSSHKKAKMRRSLRSNRKKIDYMCERGGCDCQRNRCIQRYCDCFAAGKVCDELCTCKECRNLAENEDLEGFREEIIQKEPDAFVPKFYTSSVSVHVESSSSRFTEKHPENRSDFVIGMEKVHRKGCRCKNSNCKLNYCECKKNGAKCTLQCQCLNCNNGKL
ncbi:unnamed protein product [Moneuplotes crassus]|uniref:CRC domain-containing protein n=1 Tax=Euplotes crassus TaxID=5936 RepID=A0AAD1U626_EUPCR|nr:unnamed protein product [Moneuplotes crassus]